MIVCKNITKVFGDKKVLDNFSTTFADSALTAITGLSGAGKTTLIRLLLGLEQPDSGSMEGIVGKRLSVVFQEDRLFPELTVLQNTEIAGQNGEYWLTALELFEERHAYPSSLSGGMRRRVALARALCTNGEIFILDEPFKGLDESLRERVMRLFLPLKKDKIILLVTHDRTEIDFLADAVCSIS